MLKAPSAAAIKNASNGGTTTTRANDATVKAALPKRRQKPKNDSQPNAERSHKLTSKIRNLFTISPGKSKKLDHAIRNIFPTHEKETATSKNNHPIQRSKEEFKQIASIPNIEAEDSEEKITDRNENDQASRRKTVDKKKGKIQIYDDNSRDDNEEEEEEEEDNDSSEPDGVDDDDDDEEGDNMAAMNASTSSLLGRLTGRVGNTKPKQKPAAADVVRVEPDMDLSNSLLLVRSMQRMERERAAAVVAMHMSHNSIFATPKYVDRARQKEHSKLHRAQILEEANAMNNNNTSASSLNLQHLSESSSHEFSSSPRHRKVRFNDGGNGNDTSSRFYYTGHTSTTSYGSATSTKEGGSESMNEHSMDPLHLRELKPCLKEDRKHSSTGALKNHLPQPMYFL